MKKHFRHLIASTLLGLGFTSTAIADCVLREDTASQEIPLGTFVDSTDGVTAETGLTIANTDIKLQKHGATTQANKNSGGATHIATGDYYAVLDATDTDTPGNLRIKVAVSGALPVWLDCIVVEEAVYDAFYAASAVGYVANAPVNVAQVSADTTAADTLETWLDGTAGPASPLGISRQGTAQSATGTTLVMDTGAAFADDTAIGMTVVACGSAQGYCQSRTVTDSVLTTDTLTVDTWTVTPSGTITYYLFATAPGSAGSAPTAAQIADAVWDEATSGHTTSGTFGEQLKTDIDDILVDTSTTLDDLVDDLETRLTATRAGYFDKLNITGNVASQASVDAVDDFVDTEIGALVTATSAAAIRTALGLGSANLDTQLSTIDDFLDTEIAAIKAKTDPMVFTLTNYLQVDVQKMNAVDVLGSGTAADPWNGE